MSGLATGWVSIHPLQHTWRLHLTGKKNTACTADAKKNILAVRGLEENTAHYQTST